MQTATQIKSTHRPGVPGPTCLPAHGAGDREETTWTGEPVLMAVGVGKMASAPKARQWGHPNLTKANQRGTHANRRKIYQAGNCPTSIRTAGLTGNAHASALHADRSSEAQDRPPAIDCRSRATSRHQSNRDRYDSSGDGCGSFGADAASQASKRGTPSHTGRLARRRLSGSDVGTAHERVASTASFTILERAASEILKVISGPLSRYVSRSCLRNVGGGLGQLGPVFVPVIGPHLLKRYPPTGQPENLLTMFSRNPSGLPVADCSSLNAQLLCEFHAPPQQRARRVHRVIRTLVR